MKRWLKRIGFGFCALLVVVVAVGAAYEIYAQRQAAIEHPPVGKMVDIGGRSLQIDCRGSGSPTVILENGLDIFGSLGWAKVHAPIAEISRTCAYSRAGVLWSEPAGDPRDGQAVAEDLHKLLNAAGEKPPFVIVAHSLGGPYAMIYTQHFGAEVAGLVFVDATHPDQFRRWSQNESGTSGNAPISYKIGRSLFWTGLGRILPFPNDGSVRDSTIGAYGPPSAAAMIQEQDAVDLTLEKARALRDLGTRPTFVLSGMKAYGDAETARLTPEQRDERQRRGRIWKELHDEQASWSSVSEHQLVPDSGHYIQTDKPEVVIAAVKWVVERVRGASN